jgi:hypothetical protein
VVFENRSGAYVANAAAPAKGGTAPVPYSSLVARILFGWCPVKKGFLSQICLTDALDVRLRAMVSAKSGASTAANESHNTETEAAIEIRQIKYLKNIVEQDHRTIKRLVRPDVGIQVLPIRRGDACRQRIHAHDPDPEGPVADDFLAG